MWARRALPGLGRSRLEPGNGLCVAACPRPQSPGVWRERGPRGAPRGPPVPRLFTREGPALGWAGVARGPEAERGGAGGEHVSKHGNVRR